MEVSDFRAGRENPEPYVERYMKMIDEGLRYMDEANWLVFHSLGNVGCVRRELKLEPKKFGIYSTGSIEITFPPSSPNHYISFVADKKNCHR